jgi:hypothetical protein
VTKLYSYNPVTGDEVVAVYVTAIDDIDAAVLFAGIDN